MSHTEAERRVRIFQENMKTVQVLQSLEQGSAEYGVTKFSDLTGECVCIGVLCLECVVVCVCVGIRIQITYSILN